MKIRKKISDIIFDIRHNRRQREEHEAKKIKDNPEYNKSYEMPDLSKPLEETDQEQQKIDFTGYFAEEDEKPSFRKSWRSVWQLILGAYGAFLPMFAVIFVSIFLAFMIILFVLRAI